MASRQVADRGRFQFSIDELTRYSTFREYKQTSFSMLLSQLGYSALTALLSHQLFYTLQRKRHDDGPAGVVQKLKANFEGIRRPAEHTVTVFSIKLCLDYLNQRRNDYSQYQIGATTGLLAYLIGRPLDQLELARKDIFLNQKKLISRFQAIGVVIKHDGFKGFYRNENWLAPVCGTLYRSIYFGMWARLHQLDAAPNGVLQYILFPLLSSASASIATVLPDKLRSYSLQINDMHRRALNPVYGKKNSELPSTTLLLFRYLTGPQFGFTRHDIAVIGYSVVKNWIVLSMFTAGQKICSLRGGNQQH